MNALRASAILFSVLLLAPIGGTSTLDARRNVDVLEGPLASVLDRQLTGAAAKGFGGAIVVDVGGKVVLQAGYGLANREKNIAFTARTIAQIGSITKLFTALAIAKLASERKLDVNAPVSVYVPEAAKPAAAATVQQLLTHHAGLADSCGDDFEKLSKADLLQRCMAMPLAHAPGTYAYSNLGYSILAAVVEKVSGESWEMYLRAHVWQPLGLEHTGFIFANGDRSQFAVGYLDGKKQGIITDRLARLNGDAWNLKGNGGIEAPVTDLQRLYLALTGRTVGLSGDVRAEITSPHAPGDAPDTLCGYGLFFRVDKFGKPYRIGHSGSDGVFFSYFMWLPGKDVFMYIVGNNGEKEVTPVVATAVRTLQGTFNVGNN